SSVVIIGGVLAVMGWLYLRWRKQFKNPPAIAENLPLKSQSQTPPPAANGTSPGLYSHAAKVYGQIGDEPTQKSFKKEDEEVKPFKTGESSNAVEADNEFFKTVRQEPDWQELLKEEPQRARSQADETAEYSSPGSVELAKSILRQQQKQKAEALKSLHSGDIKQDANKLSQQAKILGLEQGSLEVKKNFSDLEADEKRLAELKRKFSND
ncbi:MAG TPA: hypothetical protein VEC36_10550, partial [Patescibacteria group bacterium]|nr:hypothetical protein [Patescibacteria group bacterium]